MGSFQSYQENAVFAQGITIKNTKFRFNMLSVSIWSFLLSKIYKNQPLANLKTFSLFAVSVRQLEITLHISSTWKEGRRRSTITKEKQNANGRINIKYVLLIIPQKQMLEYNCNQWTVTAVGSYELFPFIYRRILPCIE